MGWLGSGDPVQCVAPLTSHGREGASRGACLLGRFCGCHPAGLFPVLKQKWVSVGRVQEADAQAGLAVRVRAGGAGSRGWLSSTAHSAFLSRAVALRGAAAVGPAAASPAPLLGLRALVSAPEPLSSCLRTTAEPLGCGQGFSRQVLQQG